MPFNLAWAEALVRDQAQETPTLDFKAGAALSRDEKLVTELIKDVTGFANAAGGVLVYGVAERRLPNGTAVADRVDPVRDASTTSEWISQIISSLTGPPLHGFAVTVVDATDALGPGRLVIVEVQPGSTAHQSLRDQRYYQRAGQTTKPMFDFQIRDVMSRRSAPVVRVAFGRDYPVPHTAAVHHYAVWPEISNEGSLSLEHWSFELFLPSVAYHEGRMQLETLEQPRPDAVVVDGKPFHRARISSYFRGVEHRIHPGQTAVVGNALGYAKWHLIVNNTVYETLGQFGEPPIRWSLYTPNAKPIEGAWAFTDWCRF